MAGGLARRGVAPGASVAVLAGDAGEVAALTQAAWMRRAAVTMLQQPTPRTDLEAWVTDTVRAAQTVRADLLVIGDPFLAAADHPGFGVLSVAVLNELRSATPVAPEDAEDSDIALRQLTSGSTGTPKAVEITHGNFAANTDAVVGGVDIDPDRDSTASWVPLSHDMGMVAMLCLPMQLGMQAVVVGPEEFLRRPIMWAELISEHKATLTAGPNFGYTILARVLARAPADSLDLSRLRVAINGAEPIDHRDIDQFVAAGARFGLPPTAPTPAYGMAETTLMATVGAWNEAPVVGPSGIVCVGTPRPDLQMRIEVDGAIHLRGPQVARSYLTQSGPSPLAAPDGWFDTGDVGYLDESGRLYVYGRTKDVIIVAGMNLYPTDIERAVADVDGVRRGCVAAVRIDAGAEREGFAVLAEVRSSDEQCVRAITREITARVNSRVGHAPRHVQLLPPGALPKTASGKLRRGEALKLLELS
jgi:fatty-acyl-CoA synthase